MKVVKADGTEVKRGDMVTDFRGDTAIFLSATRVRTAGRSGKVIVRRVVNGAANTGREYYDRVFGVEVTG